jgi:hypothetical protein
MTLTEPPETGKIERFAVQTIVMVAVVTETETETETGIEIEAEG